ncbi:relaxase/mobilization nuclease domain-containing protein [Flavobacterium sp. F-328]|uniref:Relaxase/mobilization nuclease domain-containing protein n=1 Tax=Flavobacterium erciyesense TaxID=2825842 RepID=A0ABS5D128_9FLAO|nr:relaxase/mobilization nuclease domain-containing protein [Flavobacterium erciyesense]MBQ0907726.1 relaxase/mobilization nuclease domain-containing protein [Flavobacterium erciyesense]
MIAKQIIGKDFYGVLQYNQKKVDKGEAIVLDSNLSAHSVVKQTKEFNVIRQLKPNLSRAVYHVSLNLPYSDSEKLTNEDFASLNRDFLEGMGFDDNQYVIFLHRDTDLLHTHVVANRVKYDGNVVSDSQNYKRSEALVRKLELKYNLTKLILNEESNVLSKGEIEKCLRIGDVPARLELQNIIFETLNANINLELFIKKLKERGVDTKLNQSTTGYISGISFLYKEIPYKGSDVHKKISWQNIKSKLNNYEQIRDHSTVPKIDAGIRASKENAIGVENTDTKCDENKHRQSSNHRQEVGPTIGKKIESKLKKGLKP